ncbi:MAG: AtpZ/AtpI family protein [Polyangiaceae bacterium]|nr:AtpZ/AtpI family protein [Polyangiaceae bacterium]
MQYHWKNAGSYSTVGLELSLSIILGLFVGQWLDEKLGTKGWMTALWFCFGLIAGGRTVYRALKRANREAEAAEKESSESGRKYLDDDHHH